MLIFLALDDHPSVYFHFLVISALHHVLQASYSVPVSINNLSTLRRWRWKNPKLTMAQINITLTLGVKKVVYLKENDHICILNKWLINNFNNVKLHRLYSIECYNDRMINWEVVEGRCSFIIRGLSYAGLCLDGVRSRITNRRESRPYLVQNSHTVPHGILPQVTWEY
jgi:hypothetical protein